MIHSSGNRTLDTNHSQVSIIGLISRYEWMVVGARPQGRPGRSRGMGRVRRGERAGPGVGGSRGMEWVQRGWGGSARESGQV